MIYPKNYIAILSNFFRIIIYILWYEKWYIWYENNVQKQKKMAAQADGFCLCILILGSEGSLTYSCSHLQPVQDYWTPLIKTQLSQLIQAHSWAPTLCLCTVFALCSGNLSMLALLLLPVFWPSVSYVFSASYSSLGLIKPLFFHPWPDVCSSLSHY